MMAALNKSPTGTFKTLPSNTSTHRRWNDSTQSPELAIIPVANGME